MLYTFKIMKSKVNDVINRLSSLAKLIGQLAGTPNARYLVIILFVIQAVFLVFTMNIGTPPDETNHIQFIDYYAHHSISPIFDNQQPTYYLGDKSREVDYLYHYGMSLIERVLPFSANAERHIIRLASVGFAVLTLIVLGRLGRLLGFSAAAITVALLIVTNLPMVLMLSSAINNDVLVWLGFAFGLLLLVRLWHKPNTMDLLWLLNLMIYGGLVKRTMIPIVLALALGVMLPVYSSRKVLFSQLRKAGIPMFIAIFLLIVGIGLFAERIGGNLISYGSITVTCEQVHGDSACDEFWLNGRKQDLDTRDAEKPISRPDFVVRWFEVSFMNVVDIQTQGWRHEVKPARFVVPLLVWSLTIGLFYGLIYDLRHFRQNKTSQWRLYVLAMLIYFVLVQLFVNYGSYRKNGFFGIALNGRYILPSLLPMAMYACYYWTKILKDYQITRLIITVLVVLTTILGSGLLMMIHNPQLFNG